MEFHNHHLNQRFAEAERWLNTAVKLLSTRDLHGTKSFAIRARESDPRLGAADHLIAVADTLLAGESDYYAILQVPRRTESLEVLAIQYRRLALLLCPQANRFPYADHAFRLVSDAWSVLSNPSNKALYDRYLDTFEAPPPLPPPPPPPQPHPLLQQQYHMHQQVAHEEDPMPPPRKINVTPVEQMPPVEEQPPAAAAAAEEESPTRDNVAGSDSSGNFWTACPFCYHLFEYSRVYEDCTLRCQSCKRAFHALAVASPPVMDNGDASFCCWAYFPAGLSPTSSKKPADWSPFSAMYAVPLPTKKRPGAPVGTRVYHDNDDDPFLINISDPGEDSDDDEWRTDKRKKKKKKKKKKNKKAGRPKGKAARTPSRASDRLRKLTQNVTSPSNDHSGGNKTSGTTRKGGAAALGKLDLNVEFSNNEVEEPATQAVSDGNGTANGEEDTIEGISFFEGLDEFLSSLPILNVVTDDKGKPN